MNDTVFDIGATSCDGPILLEDLQKVPRTRYWHYMIAALRDAELIPIRPSLKIINEPDRAYIAILSKDEPIDDMFLADNLEELRVKLESLLAVEG